MNRLRSLPIIISPLEMATSSSTKRFTFPQYANLSFVLLVTQIVVLCSGYYLDSNPYRHREVLDPDGKFVLEWIVDWEESRVIFNVTVQTKGYVGLGLSRKGKMSGADIVIGGVLSNGKPYFTDRHAIGNVVPELDNSQDWTLHTAWESNTHTFLSFSRPFDTCDKEHDLPIHDDVITLLYAYGEKDNEFEYHYQNRGTYDIYLLDPDLKPFEITNTEKTQIPKKMGDLKIWTIARTDPMPAKDTTYLCSIHRSPNQYKKQHIVGFNSVLESDVERRHIHHFLFHRCQVPEGEESSNIFERHIGGRGEECYVLNLPAGQIPTQYCREVMHVWAVGGRSVFFPDHVGLPMMPNEYFLLQMHYTNTESVPGIQLRWAFEVFYTENLRKHDAGLLTIGGLTPGSPSIMVPPHDLGHLIYGHCGSGCTRKILPPEGIHVFAINLHTHLAGQGIRLLHIRDNKELPWLSSDDNYNFNFQQNRILRDERTILPGDMAITRCVYETTDRNGTVTVGGFRSSHEMCNGFIWYYNKIPGHGVCRSEIRSDIYRNFLDIWNTTWSDSRIENIVTSPRKNAGLAVSEVGNRINWTIDKRNQLQKYHRFLPQITGCPRIDGTAGSPSSQRAPLQRYAPKRIASNNNKASSSVENEILDPEYEFVSIYPKDITPYERPDLCSKYK